MVERTLRDEVGVSLNTVGQRGLEFCGRFEVRLPDDVGDSSIEAFNHAVGLRVTGQCQAILDLQAGASFVEGVMARSLLGWSASTILAAALTRRICYPS